MKWLIILPVKLYQWLISPLFPPTCRFEPTCSNYMLEAIKEWGPLKGFYLGIRRVMRCHPWGNHGFDPVPKQNTEEEGK